MNLPRRWYFRYGLAAGAVSAAVALRLALIPLIGTGTLYITAYPAMMIVTLTLGLGPGLASTLLGIVLIEYFFIESAPHALFSFSLAVRAAILVITTVYVGWIGGRLHATHRRASAEAAAARNALNRYLSFLEVTGQVGWTTNAAGEVAEDMPAWRKFTGQTLDEIRGWGWSEALHPEDRERTFRVWRQAVQAKTNYEIEYRLRNHEGVYRDMLARGVPVFNDDGSLREWVGTCIDITERKQAEEALRQNREWLRVTLSSIGDAVIAGDTEARITFLNPVAAALTGWSEEEALGQPIPQVFNIINELTREPADRPCMRALKEKRIVTLANHTALITKEGREIPIEDSAAPIFDAAGNVAGIVLVFHDVTEKRHAQDVLRQAHDELEVRVRARTSELRQSMAMIQAERKRFRDVLDQLPAYLVLLSEDYRVTFANRFFEERFGKANGQCCYAYLFERTGPFENCESYTPMTTRAPHRWEWTGPDGLNYDIYDFPFTDVDGANLIMEVGLDITECKRAENALRVSEARLAEAQRIAHLGGWDWNVASDELSWSDEMFRIFGFAPQSFAANYAGFLACVHPEDRARVNDRVKRALDGAEPYNLDYRIVLPGDQVRILHAQGEVLFDEAHRPLRMLGTVLDITEHVRAEEEAKMRQQQLIQADKMVSLGILVAGVAHEINNPNHAIMSNVAALADVWESARPILDQFYKEFGDFVLGGYDYSESREKLPEMFANALASSKRIESIVTELRDFARYSPREKMTDVDVNAVIRSAMTLVANMVQKATDRVYVVYGTHMPPVFGNYQRIEQVVINLLQNACRALPGRDKGIFVTTSHLAESNQVLIEVRDEGVGIAEEDLKHLGDPFFTKYRAAGGMGLGLWVSFNIVHEHGGTLTFSSNDGEGTRAVLAFPAHEQAQVG